MTDILFLLSYNMHLMKAIKGEGKYAGMDDCHVRDQHSADLSGHGKNYFERGESQKKEDEFPLRENHPQKEKVERYAASFQKLADTFYGMPYWKEYLSAGQVEQILRDAGECMCSQCYHREICWGKQKDSLYRGGEVMIRALEEGDEEKVDQIRAEWAEFCGKSVQYLETVRERFQKERQNLIWGNRMIESRLAVAQQLTEISGIMEEWREIFMISLRRSRNFRKQSEKR